MADDFTLSITLEGQAPLLMAFDRIDTWTHREGKTLLEALASNAEAWIRIYAPRGETGDLVRHVSRSGVYWHPGGAGGGGNWEIVAGVKPVPLKYGGFRDSIYPLYAEKGTASEGRGYIYPRDDRMPASTIATKRSRKQTGGVMTFQKQGEERKFRFRVRGQKPQRFVFAAYHQLSVYTRTRMMSLGREIVRPG
jgi:hypothetical protein